MQFFRSHSFRRCDIACKCSSFIFEDLFNWQQFTAIWDFCSQLNYGNCSQLNIKLEKRGRFQVQRNNFKRFFQIRIFTAWSWLQAKFFHFFLQNKPNINHILFFLGTLRYSFHLVIGTYQDILIHTAIHNIQHYFRDLRHNDLNSLFTSHSASWKFFLYFLFSVSVEKWIRDIPRKLKWNKIIPLSCCRLFLFFLFFLHPLQCHLK